MKKIVFLILALFVFQNGNAQSESQSITNTLMDYIVGTSYNQTERITKAFYPSAELFLDNREKQLMILPIKEYVGFFKNAEPGTFNGRIGNIISIDQFNNIAQAKVEILIPEANLRYIDLFLLKKIDGEWKIISKTAGNEESNKKGGRVLFVTSNAHFYGDSELSTGNSFSEIVSAYETFDKAGYTIDFVSPEGGAIPLAYINTAVDLHKKYLYDSDFMYALAHTKSPSVINAEKYRAIYYVGGGSAMFGVPENESIQSIAMKIYEEQNGVVSSVCHGTAGIVNLKTKDGKYLFTGKKVSGYPDSYERKDAEYFKEFPFLIQETIEKRGGIFHFSEKRTSHVEVQERLVTGQNHLSSEQVAIEIIKILEEKSVD